MNLSHAEVEALAYHSAHSETFKKARLKENILAYLAHIPRSLDTHGPESAGEMAIAMGNLLVWIAPVIEPGLAPVECALNETPQSLHALGKLFRFVGLKYFNQNSLSERHSIGKLKNDLEMLHARFAALEAMQEKEAA